MSPVADDLLGQNMATSVHSSEAKLKLLEKRMLGALPVASVGFGELNQATSKRTSANGSGTADVAQHSQSDSDVHIVCSSNDEENEPVNTKRPRLQVAAQFDIANGVDVKLGVALPAVRSSSTDNAPNSPGPGTGEKTLNLKTPRSGSKQPPPPRGQKAINQYFQVVDNNSRDSDTMGVMSARTTAEVGCQADLQESQQRAYEHQLKEAREREAELHARLNSSQGTSSRLQGEVERLQAELQQNRSSRAEAEQSKFVALCRLARGLARCDAELTRGRNAVACMRLGHLTAQRNGALGLQEVWADGQAFMDLYRRQGALAKLREELEAARKALKRRLPPPPRNNGEGNSGSGASKAGGRASADGAEYLSPAEYVARDEMLKVRLSSLKREEEALAKEEERLSVERTQLMRQLKRQRDEDDSRFNNHAVLHKRYTLMNLLGKGGFSEVYKAYDLVGMEEVAVKIHQVSSAWSDAKKANYVRHAVREADIHKALRQDHIVSLHEVFEIDANTFATVLELCTGGDLDTYLREHGPLPEKEARVLLSQVFSGLAYLNQPGNRVIHYDLKPANILFTAAGQLKITDFGLCKVVEEGHTMGMDLTSPGAGTYWYLPPECFEIGSPQVPKISNKVDVWSAGVIFFQMLFGRRPFGEGCSQEQILRERIVLNATSIDFPPRPAVTLEAKEFLRRCLTHNQAERWDVLTAAADPYLALRRGVKAEATAGAAPGTGASTSPGPGTGAA